VLAGDGRLLVMDKMPDKMPMDKMPMESESGEPGMKPAYRHYADYLVKKAMSDPGSVDDFLRYTLFTGSLWQKKLIGARERFREFKGLLERGDQNKAIKRETLDGGFRYQNAEIIIEGEKSLAVEDIYQLLRQEAAVLEPGKKRKSLIAIIISLTDSPIHRLKKKPCPFLQITDILGPKTFIGFASINLYLIESGFYQGYFKSLWQNWSQAEVKRVLDSSFGSLLLSYWARRLWLDQDHDQQAMGRLEALKGFLADIWDKTGYGRIFYETMVLFKDLDDLVNFFDEGGLKMKSFADTMPKYTRKIYEEVLVAPVVKRLKEEFKEEKLRLTQEYGEKLKQVKKEKEREKAEKEREKAEKEREKAEKEREKAEKEKAEVEKEIMATCQRLIVNKFPDISGSALVAVNQLSFSQCNQLLMELDKIRDVHECEAFIKNL